MSLITFGGAFSFGTSQRKVFNVQNAEDPSPSQYQSQDAKVNSKSGVSFTKEAKMPKIKNEVPALGYYKVQYKQV